ncbi:transposase [Amycolatopsis thermalba]|uniref:transposase n=1 Tax=Amycolatopsis TaxID=1813 RepID=UPI003D229BE6
MDGTGTTAAHRQKAWPLAKWTERSLINGIRWRIRVGAPWRDIPQVDGPWQTGYGLFRRWQRDGTGKRILPGLQARANAAGLITWAVSVHSTTSRAPQHAAGARPRGIRRSNRPPGSTPNLLNTGSAAPGAGSRRRLIWLPSRARSRCRCW